MTAESVAGRRRRRRGQVALAVLALAVAGGATGRVWVPILALAISALLGIESVLPSRVPDPPPRDRRREDRTPVEGAPAAEPREPVASDATAAFNGT